MTRGYYTKLTVGYYNLLQLGIFLAVVLGEILSPGEAPRPFAKSKVIVKNPACHLISFKMLSGNDGKLL